MVAIQLTITIGEPAVKENVPQSCRTFQGYIPAITDEQARILFERKYGRAPAKVMRTGGSVNAGPLLSHEVARL